MFTHSQCLTHRTHTHTHSPVLTASNRPLRTHPPTQFGYSFKAADDHSLNSPQAACCRWLCECGCLEFSSHPSLPLLVSRSSQPLLKLVKPGLHQFTGPLGSNSSPKTSACYISSNTLSPPPPPPPPPLLCPARLLTSSTFQSNYSMLI